MIATILATAWSYLDWARSGRERRVEGLAELSASLPVESAPLSLELVSRDSSGIRVRARLFDLSGRELVLVERSMPGSELRVEFLLSPLPAPPAAKGERWLVLPARLSTELPESRGPLLLDSYDDAGFPAIYGGAPALGAPLDPARRTTLGELYAKARRAAAKAGLPAPRDRSLPRKPAEYGAIFGEIRRVEDLAPGREYRIRCRSDGGVEILGG